MATFPYCEAATEHLTQRSTKGIHRSFALIFVDDLAAVTSRSRKQKRPTSSCYEARSQVRELCLVVMPGMKDRYGYARAGGFLFALPIIWLCFALSISIKKDRIKTIMISGSVVFAGLLALYIDAIVNACYRRYFFRSNENHEA
jgi:hypothetical protein